MFIGQTHRRQTVYAAPVSTPEDSALFRVICVLMCVCSVSSCGALNSPRPEHGPLDVLDTLEVRHVSLPTGLDQGTLVVRTVDEWRAYLRSERGFEGEDASSPPCDLSRDMLVAWRAGTGSSGCAAPPAGFDRAQVFADRVEVGVYVGWAQGSCMAYFRPLIAACIERREQPVEFVSGNTLGASSLAPVIVY